MIIFFESLICVHFKLLLIHKMFEFLNRMVLAIHIKSALLNNYCKTAKLLCFKDFQQQKNRGFLLTAITGLIIWPFKLLALEVIIRLTKV